MRLSLIPLSHTYQLKDSPWLSLGHIMNGQACKGMKKPTRGQQGAGKLFRLCSARQQLNNNDMCMQGHDLTQVYNYIVTLLYRT